MRSFLSTCIIAASFPPCSWPPSRLLTRGIQMSKVEGRGRLFPSCKYWNSTSFGLFSNLPENSTQKLPGLTVKGKVQILFSLEADSIYFSYLEYLIMSQLFDYQLTFCESGRAAVTSSLISIPSPPSVTQSNTDHRLSFSSGFSYSFFFFLSIQINTSN